MVELPNPGPDSDPDLDPHRPRSVILCPAMLSYEALQRSMLDSGTRDSRPSTQGELEAYIPDVLRTNFSDEKQSV